MMVPNVSMNRELAAAIMISRMKKGFVRYFTETVTQTAENSANSPIASKTTAKLGAPR